MTEREKMLGGELYDAEDPELAAARLRCRETLFAYNNSRPDAAAEREKLLTQLLGSRGEKTVIEPPFKCDYGEFISVGDRVFMNFHCVLIDCAPIRIGSDVLLGPAVQIYTANHPLDWQTRREWLESAEPVTIGSDVWIGGGAIVLPGVTIGDRCVVGAGSVVTKDVPPGNLVVGNPARAIRQL